MDWAEFLNKEEGARFSPGRSQLSPAFGLRGVPRVVDCSFLRLVKILGADQPALQRSQEQDAGPDGQGKRRQHVHPQRRLVGKLQPQGKGQRGEATIVIEKNAGPSAGSAKPYQDHTCASGRQPDQAGKQRTLLAARAVAEYAGERGIGGLIVVDHA